MSRVKETILIVDDGELNRAILSELFSNRYNIIEVENGKKAMEVIEKFRDEIVVVLLDIIMPGMDGIQVLKQLRDRKFIYDIPVIMITSEQAEATALKCYDLGASDIITRPFNPDIVLRRAENIIQLFKHKFNLERLVVQQMEQLEQQAGDISHTNDFMMDILSASVQYRTGESVDHIERVKKITKVLLRTLARRYSWYGLSNNNIEKIVSASSIHNIGKLNIPLEEVEGRKMLPAKQLEMARQQSKMGCQILEKIETVKDKECYKYCYDICKYHHERWDGKGFPLGLRGEDIPIWSQVVSLADLYDSLIRDNKNGQIYTHEQAVKAIISGECGAFNPRLLDCFIDVQDILCTDMDESIKILDRVAEPQIDTSEVISRRILWLLELERRKYLILSEMSGEIIFDYDKQSDTICFSEKYGEVFDRNIKWDNTMEKIMLTNSISPNDKTKLLKALDEVTPENPTCKVEIQIKTPKGVFEWHEIYATAVCDPETGMECVGFLGKLTNIHRLKQESSIWERQAKTDAQTGLYNKKAVNEIISKLMRNASATKGALLFIDIDNFKQVNDNFGHLEGDRLLCYMANYLKTNVRSTDVVGRIGGDEFIVYLNNISGKQDISKRAHVISRVFDTNLYPNLSGMNISVSIGISCFPLHGSDYTELLNKADIALYYAKYKGKNRFEFYSDEILLKNFSSVVSELESENQDGID